MIYRIEAKGIDKECVTWVQNKINLQAIVRSLILDGYTDIEIEEVKNEEKYNQYSREQLIQKLNF